MDEKIWIDASVVLKAIDAFKTEMLSREDEFADIREQIGKIDTETYSVENEYYKTFDKYIWSFYDNCDFHDGPLVGYRDPSERIEKYEALCARSTDGKLFVGSNTVDFLNSLEVKPDEYKMFISNRLKRAEHRLDRAKLKLENAKTDIAERKQQPTREIERDEPVRDDGDAGIGPLLLIAAVVILGVVFMFSVSG